MGMVRYSLLAAAAIACSQGLAISVASGQQGRSGVSTSRSTAPSKMDHAERFEEQYRHRLSRLQRLQEIAQENDNPERLKHLDQLFDHLEKSHQTRLDATAKHLSGKARQDFIDRMKTGRDGNPWRRASKMRQDRRENHQNKHKGRHQDRLDSVKIHSEKYQERAGRSREHQTDARRKHDQFRDQHADRSRGGKPHDGLRDHRADRLRGRAQHDRLRSSRADRIRGHGQRDSLRNRHADRSRGHGQRDRRIADTSSRHSGRSHADRLRSQREHDDASRNSISTRNAKAEFDKLRREIESERYAQVDDS